MCKRQMFHMCKQEQRRCREQIIASDVGGATAAQSSDHMYWTGGSHDDMLQSLTSTRLWSKVVDANSVNAS